MYIIYYIGIFNKGNEKKDGRPDHFTKQNVHLLCLKKFSFAGGQRKAVGTLKKKKR